VTPLIRVTLLINSSQGLIAGDSIKRDFGGAGAAGLDYVLVGYADILIP